MSGPGIFPGKEGFGLVSSVLMWFIKFAGVIAPAETKTESEANMPKMQSKNLSKARRTPHVRQGQGGSRHARWCHVRTRDVAAGLEMVHLRQTHRENQELRSAAPAISRLRAHRGFDGRWQPAGVRAGRAVAAAAG